MIVGLVHPGRMGAALGALLVANGHEVRWCPDGRSPGTAERAAAAGLTATPFADLLAAPVVLSVCPPAAASTVATTVAEAGYPGVYVEANAISPARTQAISGLFNNPAVRVVDGGIVGPPPRPGHSGVRLYLSGPADAVDLVSGLFDGTAAKAVGLGPEVGTASALKMAFGSFQKTSRALAAVSHALAADFGVTEHLRAEAEAMGGNALADPGHFPNAAALAWRWGPEMREVADALRAAGLPPELAEGSAAVLARRTPDRDDFTLDTPTALTHLHHHPEP
jgi:3-hydroxyisobutyrate dehydrogenase-like beta-hydroxyacid dehydrogenase